MSQDLVISGEKWVRSADGIIAGVCDGLGKRFGIDPWLIRLGWLVSVLAFGTGLLAYLVLAVTLPREDAMNRAYEPRLLGVSARIARRSGLDVGLVRALTVVLSLASFGVTAIGYVILHLTLPTDYGRLTSS